MSIINASNVRTKESKETRNFGAVLVLVRKEASIQGVYQFESSSFRGFAT